MAYSKIVVAFSGGLDTSYLVAWLKETTKASIHTITVNTGGFGATELKDIERRATELGATQHLTIDGCQETFERVVKTLIQGNVQRGDVYPLCVSAERVTQAELIAQAALEIGADAIAHGSTGAGNDQVRFDVFLRTLAPQIEILTPIRDQGLSRREETDWLRSHGVFVKDETSKYSINAGMWGTTIGGGETHDSWKSIPDSAYPTVKKPEDAPPRGEVVTIRFEQGVPVSLGEEALSGPKLIEKLSRLGSTHGIGRGVHLGDTILGIKGRVAFEAPAAAILVTAHRELEKLVLTRYQQSLKARLADFYGMLVHEALFYDPVARDIESFIASSQKRVTGEVRLLLKQGNLQVEGVRSPYSLMDTTQATYGESQSLWNGRDAEGFTKIYGLQGRLAAMVEGREKGLK